MVGTVAYMPPEQALGGEVTPQADLYSLGAMLYELVTGKPPFVGDDPTAVISQHINTPPVAPSWHSEHCPPDLEALILKLLAKVPGDRPGERGRGARGARARRPGAEVGLALRLERARPAGARRLRRARARAGAAAQGLRRGVRRPRLVVMLVGEPGIGKTRTAQELETYARMRGAQVLWGRAHESAGAPPYWPWVQVGASTPLANDLTTLIGPADDARGAAELAAHLPVAAPGAERSRA